MENGSAYRGGFYAVVFFALTMAGCASQRPDAVSVIRQTFSDHEGVEVNVLLPGENRWLTFGDDGRIGDPDFSSNVKKALLYDVQNDPTDALSEGMDYCWIIVVGEQKSMVVFFGPYGFALGHNRNCYFKSKELADMLREMFKANGLMEGYSGRCLENELRSASGLAEIEIADETVEERDESYDKANRIRYKESEEGWNYGVDCGSRPPQAELLKETYEFILNGGDVNATPYSDEFDSRLHQAVEYGYMDVVRCLLVAGANPNIRDYVDATPLHIAASYGDTKIPALLLAAGADPCAKDICGETPLHKAFIESGTSVGLVRLLILAGADVNAKDNKGRTPLMVAAEERKHKAISLLLGKGADLNARDKDGNTALYNAARHLGKTSTTELLIKNGTTVDCFCAAALDMRDRLKQLIAADPSIIKLQNDDGTLLHIAAGLGNDEIIKLLVENGADVNALNNTGESPIFSAIINKKDSTVEYLIKNGARTDIKDCGNRTPLYFATIYGDGDEIIKLLVENGADVNVVDVNHYTPLINAIINRNRSAVRYLLENGARTDIKGCANKSPLDRAIDEGDKEIIELLKKYEQQGSPKSPLKSN